MCQCPEMYEGTSCQNPGDGYYRSREDITESDLLYERYVGKSIPCECNGRSNRCNKETGYCQVRKRVLEWFVMTMDFLFFLELFFILML